MKFARFTFMGLRGTVTKDGFMHWGTFSCQVSAARGALKDAVLLAMATL